MSKLKVVICDYEFPNVDQEKAALQKLGDIEFIPAHCTNEAEVMELTKEADGVINQWSKLNERVINNMQRCKVIATYGVGVDKINVEAATRKGIYVCNVPDYCINEVGDHAFTMLVALAKQLFDLDMNTKRGLWGFKHLKRPIYRLEGKTVGLVGFGKIPRTLAGKLQAFDMEILVYDPYLADDKANELKVQKTGLETLFVKSDFVSIHAPLTPETKYMVGEKLLRSMKPTAYLINVGRGAIVDENALYKALSQNWIAGAGVDVFEVEPLTADNPFLKLDNIILTPHAAWYTQEALADLQRGAAEEIVRVLKGEKPKSPVNKPGK